MTPAANPHHSRRWRILAILGIAQLMVVLDMTIVNVALPSAQKALHFSNDERQWIVTAYALAFGSLLLLGGKISDLFGRKWTFIAGMSGFAIASALGGAAQSFGMLVTARALQGAFAALLAPAALSLLATTFAEPSERNKAFGIYGALGGSGASVGLLLGGALTQYLSWRFAMYINLLFATSGVLGALALLHNQRPAHKPTLDIPGTLTVSGGLFAVVFGVSHAQITSWGNTLTYSALIAGAVLLATFLCLQARGDHPLLPLRVLSDRNRGASYISMGLASIGMFGALLLLTYYLQQTLGYSPVRTGLAFLPMTAAIMSSAIYSTIKLLRRHGPRPLVISGMTLSGVGMLMLTRLGLHASYATEIAPALTVTGLGLGLILSSAINTGTLGVAAADTGIASATVSASQQVGGSIGAALLSTIATSASASYLADSHLGARLLEQATIHGNITAFSYAAGIYAIGVLTAALVFPRRNPAAEPLAEPALVH